MVCGPPAFVAILFGASLGSPLLQPEVEVSVSEHIKTTDDMEGRIGFCLNRTSRGFGSVRISPLLG